MCVGNWFRAEGVVLNVEIDKDGEGEENEMRREEREERLCLSACDNFERLVR